MRIIANVLLGVLIVMVSVLLAMHFTGHTERNNATFLPSDTITVAGKIYTAEQLAEQYKPQYYLRPNTPTPPLQWVWYEVPRVYSSIVFITYFNCWENEINPNPLLHGLYSVFRAAYYGYPLYDVEYFTVGFDIRTGKIEVCYYETAESNDYFPTTVTHIPVSLIENIDGWYIIFQPSKDRTLITPVFDGQHIKAGVQTWNHLTCLLDSTSLAQFTLPQNAPLKFLSDDDYARYKFCRKSQHENTRRENIWPLIFLSLLFIAIGFEVWYRLSP